jgi:hypothetical protein
VVASLAAAAAVGWIAVYRVVKVSKQTTAYKSWYAADFEKISVAVKFSATSLPPRHKRREQGDDLIVSDSEDERVSNAASYVETEVDSSIEQDTPEPTRTRPSRLQQAVRNEVRL